MKFNGVSLFANHTTEKKGAVEALFGADTQSSGDNTLAIYTKRCIRVQGKRS